VVAFVAIYSILFPAAGLPFTWGLLLLPLTLVLHVMFTLGVGTLFARLAVQFRDMKNLLPHLTRIWFYLSPILWNMSLMDDKPTWARALVQANPIFPFLSLYRTSTLGDPLQPLHLLLAAFWAVTLLIVGVTVFWRFDRRIARYL
jgi:ABC-type polysaccharide/polyol phosphate export permease